MEDTEFSQIASYPEEALLSIPWALISSISKVALANKKGVEVLSGS